MSVLEGWDSYTPGRTLSRFVAFETLGTDEALNLNPG